MRCVWRSCVQAARSKESRRRCWPPATGRIVSTADLELLGFQAYEHDGESILRVWMQIRHHGEYADTMFEAAPDLPPCEKTVEASRTWLRMCSETGEQLFQNCEIANADALRYPSFEVADGDSLPGSVYAELWDRRVYLEAKGDHIAATLRTARGS